VDPGNPYPTLRCIYIATLTKWFVVLTYLITLGEVGIKVVFAVELANVCDRAVERETNLEAVFDGLTARNRERTGEAKTDGTGVDVGTTCSKGIVTATAKHLALGCKLDVDLGSDHWFVAHGLMLMARHFSP